MRVDEFKLANDFFFALMRNFIRWELYVVFQGDTCYSPGAV